MNESNEITELGKPDDIVLWYLYTEFVVKKKRMSRPSTLKILVTWVSRPQTTPRRRSKRLPGEEEHRSEPSLVSLLRSRDYKEKHSRD